MLLEENQNINNKILYFEYIMLNLLDWYKQENKDKPNDFSILKSMKLLFLAASCKSNPNTKSILIEDVFNNFCAFPYGHLEVDVYQNLKESRFLIDNNTLDTNGTTIVDILRLIEDKNVNEVISEIDRSIFYLKSKNKDLISYSAFKLVDICHDHFSWKTNYRIGSGTHINPETIKLEMKFFY